MSILNTKNRRAAAKEIMTTRPKNLPDFERPPLNELVLSIQFASLPFKNFHSGLLWKLFSDTYPEVEEQAPIEPTFETFGTAPKEQKLSLQLMAVPDAIRYWFVTRDGTELLQVQRDRLVHNWRQQSPGNPYPRYEPLRERFEQEIAVAASFFRDAGIGEIVCNQCEVSYINLIRTGPEGGDPSAQLAEIFTVWAEKYSNKNLSKIERGQFNISYVIPGESGTQLSGRLHIVAQAAILRAENTPAIRLALTARGKPEDESVASALRWLDLGREVVVKAFASITTKKMHRIWGRRDK